MLSIGRDLTWRHVTGYRPRPAEVALAGALFAAAMATILWAPRSPAYHDGDALQAGLALASAATLLWRRSRPMAAFVSGCALVVGNAALGYPVGAIQYPVWIGVYTVLAAADRRRQVATVGLALATVAGYVALDRGRLDVEIAIGISVQFSLAVVAGEIVRTRRALAEAERLRLLLDAREEAATREQTVLQERARLARELHDALGHAVNVMVMQAGVARHVFDERPDFAREALGQIETLGRDALVELDAVLRVLGPDDDPSAVRSTPSLAGLGALCDRIRATGRAVDLNVGDVSLSASGERAAYRIVQEAITNAARHSDRGTIDVSLQPCADRVLVTVRNPVHGLRTVRAGRGLLNMAERARIEGGDLQYGPAAEGFVVAASLPAAGQVGP